MIGILALHLINFVASSATSDDTGAYYLFPTQPIVLNMPRDQPAEMIIAKDNKGDLTVASYDANNKTWVPHQTVHNKSSGENHTSFDQGSWIYNENMRPAYAPTPEEIVKGSNKIGHNNHQNNLMRGMDSMQNWPKESPNVPMTFSTNFQEMLENPTNKNMPNPAIIGIVEEKKDVSNMPAKDQEKYAQASSNSKDSDKKSGSKKKSKDGKDEDSKSSKGKDKKKSKDSKDEDSSSKSKKSSNAAKKKKNSSSAIKGCKFAAGLLILTFVFWSV
ncbi:hypothetical protein EDEG_00914 [Edhazardia aedis USNM 41457]|uniref:Uncharacterized protein n=1 Tax=Edhazardia aedis (strain USNM 41457) TaxID=1003232 RepID=J9DUM3_EDHAE|nr:hypothetical protein EDEG_00914 [Edhazardia aedis USNM 41457]|eukprot:EJW04997.1 hypothetical protein EDEG_00914 [Edhazardia aedis USNM 41457]